MAAVDSEELEEVRREARRWLENGDGPVDERMDFQNGVLDYALERAKAGELEVAWELATLARKLSAGESSLHQEESLQLETSLSIRTGRRDLAARGLEALERLCVKQREDAPLVQATRALREELTALPKAEERSEDTPRRAYLHPKFGHLTEVGSLGDRIRVRTDDGNERVFLRSFLEKLAIA